MLAIISDVHANLAALEAVLADSRSRGCTNFISLGDVVGYGPQPAECIELLATLNVPNILGNHDSYITHNQNCSRSRVVSQIIEYQRSLLSSSQIEWLRNSHDSLIRDEMLFVHGGPDNLRDQYLYKVRPTTVPEGFQWLFSGHTHVQVFADFGYCSYCNPGSVGQPRDGDWRAAYATFDGEHVHLHRVEYDVDRTVRLMKDAGFEAFCYENLYKGTQIGGRIDSVSVIPYKENL
jgi:predicted phosphodiesterase